MHSISLRLGVLLALAFLAAPARAQEPLVERVRAAIDRGVEHGHWDKDLLDTIKPGGFTCLALQALHTCGVPPDDPAVKRGLDYIRDQIPQSISRPVKNLG